MKTVHLICNAHLDPVWQWEWQEGAAEAVSTFRVAAEFCEQYDGFVFNHNEAILYQWVEEYEPALFKRIQTLVREKKWHIMGGWYLQPDCNMPSGESFVRQILLGRIYFLKKFGVTPTTAINFDSFGHTRGLVQILSKSGFDSYLFCRPDQKDCPLEKDQFIWQGYDGSSVLATRAMDLYNSFPGLARFKTEKFISEFADQQCGVVLWGVGNHGGGPSHDDLRDLNRMIQENNAIDIKHSTPEAYFNELKDQQLPVHNKDLNAWAVGCYTSQVQIKQKHRLLENELYMTEKMISSAWSQGLMAYPEAELHQVEQDLAMGEFHDIVTGTSIEPAKNAALMVMDHGLETLSRVKARAFFALAAGQSKSRDSEIPILVYNPHPFPVKTAIACEFMLQTQNFNDSFIQVNAYQREQPIPTQVEKELSNFAAEWRKRVVFLAELAPSQMNRFDCRLAEIPEKPGPELKEQDGKINFKSHDLEVCINTKTGLIDFCRINREEYLTEKALQAIVIHDNEDTWGMNVKSFREKEGVFTLLSPSQNARVSGLKDEPMPAVRIIEDGAVRTVVEALFGYGQSYICQHYKLPKQGSLIEIELFVHWNEKDRMLKLSIPTPFTQAQYVGQVAYGSDVLASNGDEVIAHKWVAAISKKHNKALTIINEGIYGSDFKDGEIRLSLLRSPAYSGHPLFDLPVLPGDRYTQRIDQGELRFRIWLNGGPVNERMDAIDREALVCNEKPMTLSFSPSGRGEKPKPFILLSDKVVQMSAVKKSRADGRLVLRLFEPTGQKRKVDVELPFASMKKSIDLGAFEVCTYIVDTNQKTWEKANLIEQVLDAQEGSGLQT